jgi:hypothetical protein
VATDGYGLGMGRNSKENVGLWCEGCPSKAMPCTYNHPTLVHTVLAFSIQLLLSGPSMANRSLSRLSCAFGNMVACHGL